jgi:hypothetical protein
VSADGFVTRGRPNGASDYETGVEATRVVRISKAAHLQNWRTRVSRLRARILRLPGKMSPRNFQIALLVAAATVLASCSGEQVPTSPSGPAAPANVYIQSPAAIRELIGGNTDAYHVSFDLRESAGATAATIKAIDLTFSNGLTVTFGPEKAAAKRVPPGGTVAVPDLTVTGDANARAGSVQLRVLLTDDRGADSTSLAAASVTPAYTVGGRITDAATGRAVSGATVTVTFGRASGRTATSDGNGQYLLRTIPAGPVSFTVAAPGFAAVTKTADLDANIVVDVRLSNVS